MIKILLKGTAIGMCSQLMEKIGKRDKLSKYIIQAQEVFIYDTQLLQLLITFKKVYYNVHQFGIIIENNYAGSTHMYVSRKNVLLFVFSTLKPKNIYFLCQIK